MAIKHPFVSAIADGADLTLQRPSDWNADHTIEDNTIANAKLAQMATKTYKGRTTAATRNAEDVPVATLKTDLVLGKADVGLGSADNTSDANKPVSTAQQTALDLKSNLASPTFTGTVTIPTPFTLGAVSVLPTGTELNFVDGVTSAIQTQIDGKQGMLTNSAGLLAALSDETGTGLAVFNTSPVLVTPALGTPASGVLTNCTGLPTTGLVSPLVPYIGVYGYSAYGFSTYNF